jgi:hypothetical protein
MTLALKDNIDTYNLYRNITLSMFTEILYTFNFRISKEILKGYKFSMGKLGSIGIIIKDRFMGAKNINWKESNELRKQLIEEGKTPQDLSKGIKGEKWHIYYVDDDKGLFHWFKTYMGLKNIGYFAFTPTDYINTPDRKKDSFLAKVTSIDDILDSIQIGNVDKLNMILTHYPNHKSNYTVWHTK